MDGNLKKNNLDLAPELRLEIIANAEIVVHAVSDSGFDCSLQDAGMKNIRGTREIIKLAKEIKNLAAFAFISSAYSQCWQNDIEEKFYPAPVDSDEMIKIVDYFEDNSDILDILSNKITYPWPNTNSFSAAVTEQMIKRAAQHMPITVIRPSFGKVYFMQLLNFVCLNGR